MDPRYRNGSRRRERESWVEGISDCSPSRNNDVYNLAIWNNEQ